MPAAYCLVPDGRWEEHGWWMVRGTEWSTARSNWWPRKACTVRRSSSVLNDSNAPRGSIYYHFPGGKDELILAAIERAGDRAVAIVESLRGRSPGEVVSAFVGIWRSLLMASDFRIGCSLAGVTVSSDNDTLIERAASVFRSWRACLNEVLIEGGVDPSQADDISTLLLAACEGAVVMCRAERTLTPLDQIQELLVTLAESASAGPRRRRR